MRIWSGLVAGSDGWRRKAGRGGPGEVEKRLRILVEI
jgi:hypothetical protein